MEMGFRVSGNIYSLQEGEILIFRIYEIERFRERD